MAAKKKLKKNRLKIAIPENLTGALASLAAVLACFRRIGLTNTYGDLGSAFYAAAFCLYFLLFAIAGPGTANAVSSMIRARLERGNVKNARKLLGKAVLLGGAVSIVLSAAGLLGANFLCGKLLHVPLSALAFKAFLTALFPMTVFWTLTGGMDGFGSGRAPEFIRFLFYLVLLFSGPLLTAPLFEYGKKVGALLKNDWYGPAYGAMGAAFSMALASVTAMIAAVIAWFCMQPSIREMERIQDGKQYAEKRGYLAILRNSLPCLLPFVLLAVGITGQTVIYFGSIKDEFLTEGYLEWGIYMGRSGVLLAAPVLGVFAFALRMLPELKIGFLHRNIKKCRDKCMIALRCCALLIIPAAVLCVILAKPLLGMFFPEGNQTQAAALLRIGSIAIVFAGLSVVLGTILFAMDMLGSLFLDIAAGVAVNLAVLYGMLRFLDLGIYAVMCANIAGFFLLCMIFLFSIKRRLRLSFSWIRVFLAPCMGGAVMAAVCALLEYVLLKNATAGLTSLVSATAGLLVYFITVIALKGATLRELRVFPGGETMIAIAHLARLM